MRNAILSAATAIAVVAAASYAHADMAAAEKWVTEEFQPSTLTVEEQMAEMQWFVDAAKPFHRITSYNVCYTKLLRTLTGGHIESIIARVF